MTLREELRAATAETWRRYAGSAEFWEDLRADLERTPPRRPTPEAIRRGLASGRPVPEWAADYIAGRLGGTIKLPRGKPTWSSVGLTAGESWKYNTEGCGAGVAEIVHFVATTNVRLRMLLYKRGKWRIAAGPDPWRAAAALLSEHTDIPVDTILKCAPHVVLKALDEVTEGQHPPRGMKYNAYHNALDAESRHSGKSTRTLDRWFRSRWR